jgi:hypothetical protein
MAQPTCGSLHSSHAVVVPRSGTIPDRTRGRLAVPARPYSRSTRSTGTPARCRGGASRSCDSGHSTSDSGACRRRETGPGIRSVIDVYLLLMHAIITVRGLIRRTWILYLWASDHHSAQDSSLRSTGSVCVFFNTLSGRKGRTRVRRAHPARSPPRSSCRDLGASRRGQDGRSGTSRCGGSRSSCSTRCSPAASGPAMSRWHTAHRC